MLALMMSILLLPGGPVTANQQAAATANVIVKASGSEVSEKQTVPSELQSQGGNESQNRTDVVAVSNPPLMLNAANETALVSSKPGVITENIAAPALSDAGTSLMPAIVLNTPKAKPAGHPFFDKKNMIGFSVHGVTRIADAAQTCTLLNKPGRKEAWLPVHSCSGVVAYSLSMIPAQIGSSYILHRRGHHKLERWLPYLWATPSAAGVAVSFNAW